ncbi:cellulose biosynthesis protein BcsD [Salinicola aestuarinus]|uniref:cellulose biosynthesis protein BcsD n=1 Tax=Salinicola aestuarinus TaxID=1949082 RepID=UPI000DA20AB9|nr:hypothetical protein [Salinicola aestuarinus]
MNRPVEDATLETTKTFDLEARWSRPPTAGERQGVPPGSEVGIGTHGPTAPRLSEAPIGGDADDLPDIVEGTSTWSKVLDVLLDELIVGAGAAEAQPFLQRVGQRLSEDLPLGQPPTLPALESAINRRLDQLGWGWSSIRDAGQHLIIEQGDYPMMSRRVRDAAERQRLIGLSWILSGLYQGWLGEQGGHGEARCHRCHAQQTLIFHYGSV